jgi:type III secretion protein L
MKFFTLFSKEEIHLAPEDRIVPSSEVCKLLTAEEILQKAQEDIKKYREDAEKELILLKEKKSEEGFSEGLSRFNTLLIQLNEEIKHLTQEFQKQILPIALKAAKKILGEEIKLYPDRIVDIVIQALKPLTEHRKIKIYANKEDLQILEKEKPRIKEILKEVEILSILERSDVQKGGCIIETEAGIINAQLENQWNALETSFKSFAEKRRS